MNYCHECGTRLFTDDDKFCSELCAERWWHRDDDSGSDVDESMDGDHESGLASAGFGTDEDYGYFGGEDF